MGDGRRRALAAAGGCVVTYILHRDKQRDFWLVHDGVTLIDAEGDSNDQRLISMPQRAIADAVVLSQADVDGLLMLHTTVVRFDSDWVDASERWTRIAKRTWDRVTKGTMP